MPGDLVCMQCDRPFTRPGKRGPVPKKCRDCTGPPGYKSKPLGSTFTCQYCREVKDRPGIRGPIPSTCTDCQGHHYKLWRQAWLEQHPGYAAQYYTENRDRMLAQMAAWRERNPDYDRDRYYADVEYHRARSRQYRINNPNYWPEYYAANRDAIIAKTAQYQHDYPTVRQRKNARRNQRVRCGTDAEFVDPIAVFQADGWTCGICREGVDPQLRWPDPGCAELDHIIPLSRGGQHTRDNAQCAHRSCNMRKGASLPA